MPVITPLGPVWTALAAMALTAVTCQLIANVLWKGLWEPLRLRRIMAKQGVKALPFRFLFGQLLEQVLYMDSFPEVVPIDSYAALSPTVTPQYALFFPKFPGKKYFLYWWGTATRLAVRDPEIAKEVFVNSHESLKKTAIEYWFAKQIFGKGIFALVGDKWATERRTIRPFFHQDALKEMVEAMVEGTATEMYKWEQIAAQAGGSAEIDVEPDVHKIAGRVLALTAFGGDFEKGEHVYELQTEIAKELFQMLRDLKFWLIPLYRRIPTKQHRHIDRMISEMDAILHEVINGRLEAVRNGETSSYGKDLVGRMITAATDGWEEQSREFNLASVHHNCKLILFAGQDTVATTVVYTMLMLALHPEWQARARNEVLEVLGDEENFNISVLSHLKVVGMILNETLRTFSPTPTLSREAAEDLQLKDLFIPKGMTIEFAAGAIHQDRDYWGDNVAEYNPERFANGVSGACSHPQAFNPFGLGPKMCIGSTFAMIELKIIVSRVLRRFEILPSPNYKHRPTYIVVTKPKYGLPIILKAL